MMPNLPAWFTDEITVVRAAARTDRYGDEIVDWESPTEHAVNNCKVNPVAGTEDAGQLDDRAALTRRWNLAAPPDADIKSSDRIRWAGDLYEVEGEVLQWRSPLGGVDHLYVQLVRWEG